jgi:hypothetical protein
MTACDIFENGARHRRIAANMRQCGCRVARGLPFARARPRDPLGDVAASFGRRRQDQIGGGDRRHFDVQVDAIEQRAGYARLIVG